MFDTNEAADKIDPDRAVEAHHIISKNIFLSNMAQNEIFLAKGFISTIFKDIYIDKWKNLRKTIQYLQSTKNPPHHARS